MVVSGDISENKDGCLPEIIGNILPKTTADIDNVEVIRSKPEVCDTYESLDIRLLQNDVGF